MILDEDPKNGIYSLRTRRFGTVAEIMIKKMIRLEWGNSISHDLYNPKSDERSEVKFSTAMKANKSTITVNNVLSEVVQATNKNRMFNQTDWKEFRFDCNIQQVKRNEGEGQFHLNNKTYEYHKKNHFFQSLTYEDLLKIFK